LETLSLKAKELVIGVDPEKTVMLQVNDEKGAPNHVQPGMLRLCANIIVKITPDVVCVGGPCLL